MEPDQSIKIADNPDEIITDDGKHHSQVAISLRGVWSYHGLWILETPQTLCLGLVTISTRTTVSDNLVIVCAWQLGQSRLETEVDLYQMLIR